MQGPAQPPAAQPGPRPRCQPQPAVLITLCPPHGVLASPHAALGPWARRSPWDTWLVPGPQHHGPASRSTAPVSQAPNSSRGPGVPLRLAPSVTQLSNQRPPVLQLEHSKLLRLRPGTEWTRARPTRPERPLREAGRGGPRPEHHGLLSLCPALRTAGPQAPHFRQPASACQRLPLSFTPQLLSPPQSPSLVASKTGSPPKCDNCTPSASILAGSVRTSCTPSRL